MPHSNVGQLVTAFAMTLVIDQLFEMSPPIELLASDEADPRGLAVQQRPAAFGTGRRYLALTLWG